MAEISGKTFKVVVRPNSGKNAILGYDACRQAYKVNIKAPAEDNKANRELVKFLSKELKKRAVIKSGFTGRTKLITTE